MTDAVTENTEAEDNCESSLSCYVEDTDIILAIRIDEDLESTEFTLAPSVAKALAAALMCAADKAERNGEPSIMLPPNEIMTPH